MTIKKTFSIGLTTILATTSLLLAANKTPGDDIGPDHTGFAFNSYAFVGVQGEGAFAKHVGTGAAEGQQYAISSYSQGPTSTNVPAPCTVANFYSIIHDNELYLAAMLFISHGATNVVSVEPFEKTAAGLNARDARYQDYLDGNVPGCPAFTASEIYKSSNAHAYAVGITSDFIRNHGKMNESLTFVATCKGSTMTDDFVAAGGRVSVGFVGTVMAGNLTASVTRFFARLDGQEGIALRSVSPAMNGLAHALNSSGQTDTTLAPAVTNLDAPCPVEVGDKIVYTFDTDCEQAITGDIVGDGITVENEVWLTKTTLQGTVTGIARPDFYELTLEWEDVFSDQNTARLDGNTRPNQKNAQGPAHDDYYAMRLCPVHCVADITGDATIDVADLLALLDVWGTDDSSADIDGDGIVNITDLLAMLATWGQPCETGACCFEGYCINDVSAEECTGFGGDYLGDDSLCDDTYICTKIGACCFPPYECYDDMTEDDCLFWGGTFEGENSTCESSDCWYDPLGACCYDDFACLHNIPLGTCELSGGYFLGPDTNCFDDVCPYLDLTGACCINTVNGSTCVDFTTEEECYYLGGEYSGDGTLCESDLCAPVGACCVDLAGSPSCMDFVTQDMCEDGSWYEGASCTDVENECNPPWGACCFQDNTCWDGFEETECLTSGGTFFLEQTCGTVSCDTGSTGACCWSDGTCSDGVYEEDCYYAGGVYTPDMPCASVSCGGGNGSTGACCWYDGTCSDGVDEDVCYYAGGVYTPDTPCDLVECAIAECPPGEIADCMGNCAPASWLGDGICDDGSYEYNGFLIYFNCSEFDCDGGDCDPGNCNG
ncbi:MAG: hypothetical protein MK116_06895 [Phycisphaerales bacterium]|nr:hypothetical protein [Phycisphaerales bacterium]